MLHLRAQILVAILLLLLENIAWQCHGQQFLEQGQEPYKVVEASPFDHKPVIVEATPREQYSREHPKMTKEMLEERARRKKAEHEKYLRALTFARLKVTDVNLVLIGVDWCWCWCWCCH